MIIGILEFEVFLESFGKHNENMEYNLKKKDQ